LWFEDAKFKTTQQDGYDNNILIFPYGKDSVKCVLRKEFQSKYTKIKAGYPRRTIAVNDTFYIKNGGNPIDLVNQQDGWEYLYITASISSPQKPFVYSLDGASCGNSDYPAYSLFNDIDTITIESTTYGEVDSIELVMQPAQAGSVISQNMTDTAITYVRVQAKIAVNPKFIGKFSIIARAKGGKEDKEVSAWSNKTSFYVQAVPVQTGIQGMKNQINIFPNPVTDILNISGEAKNVKIFSLEGKKLLEINNQNRISVANLNGYILVQVNNQKAQKILIIK